VDISNDHMRRELGEIGAEHDRVMKLQNETLDRVVNERDLTPDEQDRLFLGGLNRRKFLTIGGVTIASAAIFAACGSSTKTSTPKSSTTTPSSSSTSTSSSSKMGTTSDLTILRTASSLEVLAVDTYNAALKSGLVTSKAVAAAATDFRNQHMEHAAAFEAATKAAGGVPYTKPNSAVDAAVIAPLFKKAKNQTDVVEIAYLLETAAAETYASTIGAFDNLKYNVTAASVAGIESRHVTVLGTVLASVSPSYSTKYPAYAPSGFLADKGSGSLAVKPGTGGTAA